MEKKLEGVFAVSVWLPLFVCVSVCCVWEKKREHNAVFSFWLVGAPGGVNFFEENIVANETKPKRPFRQQCICFASNIDSKVNLMLIFLIYSMVSQTENKQ